MYDVTKGYVYRSYKSITSLSIVPMTTPPKEWPLYSPKGINWWSQSWGSWYVICRLEKPVDLFIKLCILTVVAIFWPEWAADICFYVWKALPVVHILPELKKFYPSVIVNQLMGLGIAPLATELPRRSLPLAGRLQHFKSNWVRITGPRIHGC